MFARAVRAAPAAAVAAAALWGPLAADVAHAAGRFAEGTPEYDAAKAFYEGKHQVCVCLCVCVCQFACCLQCTCEWL